MSGSVNDFSADDLIFKAYNMLGDLIKNEDKYNFD